MTMRLWPLLAVLLVLAPVGPRIGVRLGSPSIGCTSSMFPSDFSRRTLPCDFSRRRTGYFSEAHPTLHTPVAAAAHGATGADAPASKESTHKTGGQSVAHRHNTKAAPVHNGKGAPHKPQKKAAPRAGISGTVRDRAHLLSGAAIKCTQGRHSWQVKSGRRGAYRLALAPGRYRCAASAQGHKTATARATVHAHKLTFLSFTLATVKAAPRPRPTSTPPPLPTLAPTAPPSGPVGGETCAWTSTSAPYRDTDAFYWASNVRADPGLILTIAGTYPRARYASLQVYTAQGAYITGFDDAHLPPDPGSANPFVAGTRRGTGRYTIHVLFAPAPARPLAGTLYVNATAGATLVLVYRVYLPDLGASQQGDVPLPAVTAVSLDSGAPQGCPLPGYTPPVPAATATPLTATPSLTTTPSATPTATPIGRATSLTPTRTPAAGPTLPPGTTATPTATPFRFLTPLPTPAPAGFTRQSGAQLGGYDNPDGGYLISSLPPNLGVYVIHFKPPTTPHTLNGGRLSGHAQVRYWSLCVYSVIGPLTCIADEQAQLDQHGELTVVLGATWARPPDATSANGVVWVDLGPYYLLPYKVILRELLPAPSFTSSVLAVPLGAAPDPYMGSYTPALLHCSTAQYQANGCG